MRPMLHVVEDPPAVVLTSCEMAIAAGAMDGLRVVAADLPDAFVPRGAGISVIVSGTPGAFDSPEAVQHVVGREPMIMASERPTNGCVRSAYSQCLAPSIMAGPVVLDRPASSVRWIVSGTTRDSTGAALAGCRVVLLDASRLTQDSTMSVVDTMISANVPTGGFTFEVPGGGDFWIIAYLPGSPDRAGATLHPITPTNG